MKFALANIESQVPETLNPFHQHFHILFMNHKFLIVTGLYIGRPQQFEQVFIFCRLTGKDFYNFLRIPLIKVYQHPDIVFLGLILIKCQTDGIKETLTRLMQMKRSHFVFPVRVIKFPCRLQKTFSLMKKVLEKVLCLSLEFNHFRVAGLRQNKRTGIVESNSLPPDFRIKKVAFL